MSRILIAEDEPRLSSFLSKGLRAAGYSTTICDNGIRAALLARDADFDLLILAGSGRQFMVGDRYLNEAVQAGGSGGVIGGGNKRGGKQ